MSRNVRMWSLLRTAFICVLLVAGSSGCNTKDPAKGGSSTTQIANSASRALPSSPPGPLLDVPGLSELRHRPLIALFEWDPWNTVIGSDTPTIVVYEDGLVIQNSVGTDKGPRWNGLTSQLEPAQAEHLARALATPEFLSLPRRMVHEGNMDAPRVDILLRQGQAWKHASVDGLRRGSSRASDPSVATFQNAYLTLLSPDVPEGRRWIPDEIEVLLWDYEYAREAVPWPDSLPAPRKDWRPRPSQERRPGEGIDKHVLPGRYEDAARLFLRDLGDNRAVQINGTKLSMMVRRRTPAEPFLREVIRTPSPAQ